MNNRDQEIERTLLANERTLLSYVRTAFAMALFGFAFIELSEKPISQDAGLTFVISGLVLLIIGLVIFVFRRKSILRDKNI